MSPTLGIRLEDKSQWERRVPLVPADLSSLIQSHGLDCVVQPSDLRIYSDGDFLAAGARVDLDLSPAQVIFAVKEIPLEKLLPSKTYAFFAHVIKGQVQNMPLLARLLELGCTLIDYERIVDETGRRLVLFGRQAGQAGMIDSLAFLGQRWQQAGFENPLCELRQAYHYDSLEEAEEQVARVGQLLRQSRVAGQGPLVVGFTGRGNVSRGAQEIFDLLPHELVAAEELATLAERYSGVNDRIFKVVFEKHHLAAPKDPDRTFDEAEYREFPQRFRARLPEFLPYLDALINGIYWTPDYPRFFSRRDAMALWRSGRRKLTLVGDITCDIDGAIELTYEATQPDHPTYVYRPDTDDFREGIEAPGIAVLAVDNLPCELPREASKAFSEALRGFVPAITRADYSRPFPELDLPPEILRAVVSHQGALTPDYRYLSQHLQTTRTGA